MSLRAPIRAYVLDNFLFTDDQTALKDSASFLEEGIVDSTGVLELVMFVEQEFQISVDDEEIIPENFDSVLGLVRYLETKQGKANGDAG
jgi:acyl carrier protein